MAARAPSWQSVSDVLDVLPAPHTHVAPGPAGAGALPLLVRDRNGWCPYSERVWLALHAKGLVEGLDYAVAVVDNQGDKPPWWYERGGSTTPAVLWSEEARLQGESAHLLEALDERFPNSAPVWSGIGDAAKRDRVAEVVAGVRGTLPAGTRPSSRCAFLYSYAGPVSRAEFEETLDEVERLLGEDGSGPFLLGESFTAADAAYVPFLERFAVQLPLLHDGLSPRDPSRWPRLSGWFDALEDRVPGYAARVQGDAESWAAVLAVAGYGNAGRPEGYRAPEIAREVDAGAAWGLYRGTAPERIAETPALDAALRLFHNREAVASDVLRSGTTAGALGADAVDEALRALVGALAGVDGPPVSDREAAALVGGFLCRRMCVPRDMGALSARALRDAAVSLAS